jgi:ABC-type nitrate/sulfonate/bicarbonate transport system substrate-binding protein
MRTNVIRGLVGLALLLAACAPAAAPTTQQTSSAPPVKLIIARTSGPASALLYIADDQGFLKANGLDAEVRNYPSTADATNALAAGEIVGAQPSAQIVNSLLGRGADVKVLAVVSRNPRDMKVVGRSGVSGPADLKGKKVAVVAGSASEFLMTSYLAGGQLKTSDVELVKADAPEIVALMDRGDAEAFALWEPFPANALKVMGDKGKVLAVSEDLGYKGSLYQVMSSKFIAEHPDVPAKLMKAYIEAEAFMKAQPDKTLQIVATASKLEPAVAKPLVDAADFRLVADQDMLGELQKLGTWLKDVGQLKEVPDYAKAIDASGLQKVDPSRVTLKT